MTISTDLLQQMARELLGRDAVDPALMQETAGRLNQLVAKVRAFDEGALQRVAPAFGFNPASPSFSEVAPQEPPLWEADTAPGGTGYGGTSGLTGVAAPPPAGAPSPAGHDFLWWSAVRLADAIRNRQLSPVEITGPYWSASSRQSLR